MAPTSDPTHRRRAAIAAAAVLAALAALLALDEALWRARGAGLVARGVYAEIRPLEDVSPLALEPVELPATRVPLGGLERDEALARLRAAVGGEPGTLVLRDPIDGRTWARPMAELGLEEWAPRAARAALAVGREGVLGGWFGRQAARLRGHRVQVSPSFDAGAARAALEALAPEVDVAPRDAGVELDADGAAERPGVLGHQLDVERTMAILGRLADKPAAEVAIAVARTAPAVFDAGNVAAALDLIRSGPLTMVDRGRAQTFVADAATVGSWFSLVEAPNEAGTTVPSIAVDREAIRAWLDTLAPQVYREPGEGRYRWVDGRIEVLAPPLNGYVLDVDASVDRVVDAAYADPHRGELVLVASSPTASRRAAEALLDVAPVASASTSLIGSPSGRLAAVGRAAERLDGSVVPPGGELSLRDALGAVSPEEGYDAVWLAGPRDWLDQVATTAFRAALRAGLPIPERHAPAWRSGWHEPPVGVDAAIDAVGGPAPAAPRDLRIANDTSGWVLFVVVVDPVGPRLRWSVWTADEPRAVRLEGPTVTALDGIALPEPQRLVAPGMAPGTEVQVGFAREGAEARLGRIVVVGSELRRDAFESRYAPAPDVFVAGSGVP